jgi:hypothetical protein
VESFLHLLELPLANFAVRRRELHYAFDIGRQSRSSLAAELGRIARLQRDALRLAIGV